MITQQPENSVANEIVSTPPREQLAASSQSSDNLECPVTQEMIKNYLTVFLS